MLDDETTGRWTLERIVLVIGIVVLALVGVGGYVGSHMWHAHQPQRHAGMLRYDSSYQRDAAVRYFMRLGPEALPHLQALLDSDNPNQRAGAVYILRKMGYADLVPEDRLIEFYLFLTRGNAAFERSQFGQDPWGREGWPLVYAAGPKAYAALVEETRTGRRPALSLALLSEHATPAAIDAMVKLLDCRKKHGGWSRGDERGESLLCDLVARQIAGLTGRVDLFERYTEPRKVLDPRIQALKNWWARHRSDPIDELQRDAVDRILADPNPSHEARQIASRIVARDFRRDVRRMQQFRQAWQTMREQPREAWVVAGFAQNGIDVSRPWDEDDVGALLEQVRKRNDPLASSADWLLRHMFGKGPMLFEPPHAHLEAYIQPDTWHSLGREAGAAWSQFVGDPGRPPLDEGAAPKPAARF